MLNDNQKLIADNARLRAVLMELVVEIERGAYIANEGPIVNLRDQQAYERARFVCDIILADAAANGEQREPDIGEALQALSMGIDLSHNPQMVEGKERATGFALLAYNCKSDPQQGLRVNYLTNATEPKQVAEMMKFMASQLEREAETKGKGGGDT